MKNTNPTEIPPTTKALPCRFCGKEPSNGPGGAGNPICETKDCYMNKAGWYNLATWNLIHAPGIGDPPPKTKFQDFAEQMKRLHSSQVHSLGDCKTAWNLACQILGHEDVKEQ